MNKDLDWAAFLNDGERARLHEIANAAGALAAERRQIYRRAWKRANTAFNQKAKADAP